MTRAPEMVAPVEAPAAPDERVERHGDGASIGMRAVLVAGGLLLSLVPWLGLLEGGWQTVVAAFVVTLVGVTSIARALGARALAMLPALVVAVPWLTLATAPQEALLGLVPTRASLVASWASLESGITQLLWTPGIPVPMTPDVVGVLLVAVLLLWLLVDALLALGVPALAAAPLLLPTLMTMAYRVEVDPMEVVPVVAAMAGFLVLGRRERSRARALAAGVLVIVAAVVAPAVAPSPREVDIDWPAWMEGPAVAQGGSGPPMLSTGIDLAADLQRASPVRIFDYAPSDGLPMLTRLTSLSGIGPDGFVEERGELTTSFDDLGARTPGTPITTQFTLGRAFIGNVPIPVLATSTSDFSGTWRWDPASQSIGFTDPDRIVSLNDQTYAVESVRPTPIPEGESPTADGAQEAREVPPGAAFFDDLALDIVDMSAPPLERAQQIEAYMTDDSWTYSERVPLEGFGTAEGGQWGALMAFMDARSGYCVHYASATAILARAAGIPARVSIGFLPGTDPNADGTYTVTTNDMHAWAELWFDGYGWVPFDTTPGIAGGGTVASAEDDDEAGATEQPTLPSPTAAAPSPSASASPSPSAAPTPSSSADAGAAPTATGPPGAGAPIRWDLVARPILVLLALLLVVATPATVREVLRRRRIAEGAGGALWEVQATLADAGERVPTSRTPGEIAAAVAALPLRERERRALDRLRDAAERERFAGEPSTGHAKDARAVIAGIRRTIPRRERLLRALAPPSLVRVWRRDRADDDEHVSA
ncbi:transglutaminase-like domain-containing protein [Agrococcus sp. SGAir0287]|uniref:transglutaminase-like domain-containing protein n=1 Tax=Agrococcus sp. SGAir0287 TaxID=2070347 RepID=UPI0015862C4B|nr:transglutaminase-like domain-containing protein [Agrococcus sp. SGAir0287]